MIDLRLVVLVDKGFDCGNRRVDRAPPEQGRQGAGQPSGQAPGSEQTAAFCTG